MCFTTSWHLSYIQLKDYNSLTFLPEFIWYLNTS